jgi:hypothetical protein
VHRDSDALSSGFVAAVGRRKTSPPFITAAAVNFRHASLSVPIARDRAAAASPLREIDRRTSSIARRL